MKTLIIAIAMLVAAINLQSQEPIWKIRNIGGQFALDVKISSDNRFIYTMTEGSLWKQDFNTGVHLDTIFRGYGTLYNIALLEDSLLFIGGGFPDQKPVKVINLNDTSNTLNNININIPGASIASYNIHLNKQKRHLFINLIKGAAVYDINTNEIIKTFGIEDEEAWHTVGKYSGDGRFLYVSNDKRIIKYDANTYEQIGGVFYESFDTRVKDIDVNFDGSLVAIAYNEKAEVYVVNETGTVAAYNPSNEIVVYKVKFITDELLFIDNSSKTPILNVSNNSNQLLAIGGSIFEPDFTKTKIVMSRYYEIGSGHIELFDLNILTNLENNEVSENVLYPNPTNGSINIQFNVSSPSPFHLEITNLAGQTLFQLPLGHKDIGVNNHNMNIAYLPIGNYNLRIYSPSQTFNFNVIKGE